MCGKSHLHGTSNPIKDTILNQMRYLVDGNHLLLDDFRISTMESTGRVLAVERYKDNRHYTDNKAIEFVNKGKLISKENLGIQLIRKD